MNKSGQKKADQSNRDRQLDLIKYALMQLDPAHISDLSKQFLPQIMNQQNALGQTALHGLLKSQYQRGLGTSPGSLAAETGLRANFANNAIQQAFQQAMGLAQNQAAAFTGQPFQQTHAYPFGNDFERGVAGAFNTWGLTQRGGPAQYGYSGYNTSGPAWTQPGWNPTPSNTPPQEPGLFD